MKMKDIPTKIKAWIAAGAAIVGVLVALGMSIDTPVWSAELKPIEQQVGMNQKMILQLEINAITREIWLQEDRLKVSPNPDGELRYREMLEHRKLLEQEKAALEKQKNG